MDIEQGLIPDPQGEINPVASEEEKKQSMGKGMETDATKEEDATFEENIESMGKGMETDATKEEDADAAFEEKKQSMGKGMKTDATATEEEDAAFFKTLTSAYNDDVMAEMLDLRKEVEDQMKDVRADVKGQINQLQANLSDQIGALKSLILQEKGGQPQDDGNRRSLVGRVFQSLMGGKQEEAEQGRADKADSEPSEPGSPAGDWLQQVPFYYDDVMTMSRDSDTFPGSPWTPLSGTPRKHYPYLYHPPSDSGFVDYDPYKYPSLFTPYSSFIVEPDDEPSVLIDERGIHAHAHENFQNQEGQGKDCAVNVKKYISSMFEVSLEAALQDKYEADSERSVAPITGDYHCYHPMGLLSSLKGKGLDAASVEQAIRASLADSQIVQSCYVEGPGLSFVLSDKWMAKIIQNMLNQGIKQWAPKLLIQKAFVDFSSPQTADDMRLSHFRAAIMGESIARMLQFLNVKVLRSTHVTTCGTQGWELICPIEWEPMAEDTCKDLHNMFKLAGVEWQEEEGSFYSHKEKVLQILNVSIPLALPSDVLTELTSVWYRLEVQRVEWVIYITSPEHESHFDQVLKLAKFARWLSDDNGYPKASHISADKLSHTRRTLLFSGLIDEAKIQCQDLFVRVKQSPDQRQQNADAVAYASLKYAILKNTCDEVDINQMFNGKGNTAVYLLRTYSWICQLIQKSGLDLEDLKRSHEISFENGGGRPLGAHLIRFPEIVEEACTFLEPGILCNYLYELALIFTKKFYVSEVLMTEKKKKTRYLLCEATRNVMLKCFELLGIPALVCYF